VLVDATLNSLSILIRARPHIANKILNVILNFNPLKQANSPMTPKLRVMVKSMEKTTRSLLVHILKRFVCLNSCADEVLTELGTLKILWDHASNNMLNE
jgi:hypothetical protein